MPTDKKSSQRQAAKQPAPASRPTLADQLRQDGAAADFDFEPEKLKFDLRPADFGE